MWNVSFGRRDRCFISISIPLRAGQAGLAARFFFPLWLYCFFASSLAIRTCDSFFYGVRHEQRASVTCVAPLCNIRHIQYGLLGHYMTLSTTTFPTLSMYSRERDSRYHPRFLEKKHKFSEGSYMRHKKTKCGKRVRAWRLQPIHEYDEEMDIFGLVRGG